MLECIILTLEKAYLKNNYLLAIANIMKAVINEGMDTLKDFWFEFIGKIVVRIGNFIYG